MIYGFCGSIVGGGQVVSLKYIDNRNENFIYFYLENIQ